MGMMASGLAPTLATSRCESAGDLKASGDWALPGRSAPSRTCSALADSARPTSTLPLLPPTQPPTG